MGSPGLESIEGYITHTSPRPQFQDIRNMAPRRSFLVVAFLAASLVSSSPPLAAEANVTAVFVFGDSLADIGNNNFIAAAGNYTPYGVDFPGGMPTGRYSNGYNSVDFVAQMLGFKQSPPPYLAIKDRPVEFFYDGVSYASGGSGILNVTNNAYAFLSLDKQIADFKETVERIASATGKQNADEFLSKAVFMFLTGSNDMFQFRLNSLITPLNETHKEQFVAPLAATFKGQLQRLHELGARKFAVIGTALMGCVPMVRLVSLEDHTFAEDMNDLSWRFNVALKAVLDDLSTKLEGMEYSLTNSYRVFENIIANPQHFGYTEVESACCGRGMFNSEMGCEPNTTFCSDRKEFMFWDRSHPTEKTYRLVAMHAYSGSPIYATPVNIQQLAGKNSSLEIEDPAPLLFSM